MEWDKKIPLGRLGRQINTDDTDISFALISSRPAPFNFEEQRSLPRETYPFFCLTGAYLTRAVTYYRKTKNPEHPTSGATPALAFL
jgi:hypothetical protein